MEEILPVFPVCFSLNIIMGLDYGPMKPSLIQQRVIAIKDAVGWLHQHPTSRIRAVSSSPYINARSLT